MYLSCVGEDYVGFDFKDGILHIETKLLYTKARIKQTYITNHNFENS